MCIQKRTIVALILSVCAVLLSGSCTLERKPAVLRLASHKIDVSSDGGQSRMILYIDYPLHGARPQCKCSPSWISNLRYVENQGNDKYSATGTIYFNVDRNTGKSSRSAVVSVYYPDVVSPSKFTIYQEAASASSGKNISITANGVSFEMVYVKGGTFRMGAQSTNSSGQNYDSEADGDESPVHQVTLSDYYVGQTEVTQGLWEAVMGSNPSHFKKGDNYPVEQVSWNDIQTFLSKLNSITGRTFVLPTEAQWEFAACGGTKSNGYKYSGSNTAGNVAWYYDNSSSSTHSVGTKQPNELGIYDMSGNVWEWCKDWYGSYGSSSQTNPQGPSSGSGRVLRGGGWSYCAVDCRVAYRSYNVPDNRYSTYGFRLALLP